MPLDVQPLIARLTSQMYGNFGGMVVTGIYHHTTPEAGIYDLVTGDYAPATATDVDVDVILTRYRTHELSDVILSTDWKAMIQQSALSFRPRETDSITLQDGVWRIVPQSPIGLDVARVVWVLQLRLAGPQL